MTEKYRRPLGFLAVLVLIALILVLSAHTAHAAPPVPVPFADSTASSASVPQPGLFDWWRDPDWIILGTALWGAAVIFATRKVQHHVS